jgi:hypothetical protein
MRQSLRYFLSLAVIYITSVQRPISGSEFKHQMGADDLKVQSPGRKSRVLLCFQAIYLTPLRQLPVLFQIGFALPAVRFRTHAP